MKKMEINDWIMLNNIIYKIYTTECFDDMRYELLDQLKMVLDFDSADFYMASTEEEIGRASVGKECVRRCRSRWSPYH